MNKINIDYFDLSGIGRRSNNEDKSLCAVKGSSDSDNRVIIAVADGMGGLEAGQVASQRVYDLLVRFYQEGLPVDFQQAAGKVSSIIKSANRDIYELSQKKGGIQMGTTVSGAVIVGNRCLVFNVGDSRTYLIRGAAMKQVSEDHSIDRESVKAGAIKEEDIGKGLYSNALTRSVGTDPEVEIDIFPKNHFFEMERGDILFSCTDGLWNKVTDADILKVFNRNRNIKKALEILYDLAYRNGSKDNISMAAYRYDGHEKRSGTDSIKPPPALLPPGGNGAPVVLGKKPKIKKRIDIYRTSLIAAIIGFSIVFAALIYNYISTPGKELTIQNDNQKQHGIKVQGGPSGSPSSSDNNRDNEISKTVSGGVIKFEPGKSSLSDDEMVILSIKEPLKSNGENIDADIYYTLDGSEPAKENGKKYKIGEPLVFQETGSVTIKARAIARVGKSEGEVYSKGYVIDQGPVIGGEITFLKPGGDYIDSVEIPLSYKTLKFARGKAILGEIRYTLDGSDPTRKNGSLYKEGEPVVLSRVGKYTLKAKVFSRDEKYEAQKVFSQTYTIQKKVEPPPAEVIGGLVGFDKEAGEHKAPLQFHLNFEPFRFSNGEEIPSDLYYTTDGKEPTKAKGKRYSPGESIGLVIEGTCELKAKVFSKDGRQEGKVYSRKYIIKNPPPPPPGKSEIVTDVDELDQKNIKEVLDRIKKIDIDLNGIENTNRTGPLQIKIEISQKGEARLVEILDFTAEPAEKFAEIKSALAKEIQGMKFPPLTRKGKPVNAELVVVSMKKILFTEGKYKFVY